MKRYARPVRSRRSANRSMTWAWTPRSSAEVGSSQTTSAGPVASARAMATRCSCPPESSRGKRWASPGSRPTCRSSPATASGRSRRGVPCTRRANATASPARSAGLSEPRGFCGTYCRRARTSRAARPRNRYGSWPAKRTLPLSGASSPRTRRARVDLPEPDSPTRPVVPPAPMRRLTPSRARWPPGWRLTTRSTVSSSAAAAAVAAVVGAVLIGVLPAGRPPAAW